MRAMVGSPKRSLAGLTVALMLAAGVLTLVGFTAGWFFRGEVPSVIAYANIGAAVLELSLALGILRRARAPWAFMVSVEGAMTLVNLLGLAAMLRAGAVGQATAVLCAVRVAILVLLIVDKSESR